MKLTDGGGPAFPGASIIDVPNHADPETGETLSWTRQRHEFTGMSLRDWFAGQALAGFLTRPNLKIGETIDASMTMIASRSYQLADAMIAERDK